MQHDIRELLTQEQQMSEALLLNAVLAVSGGLQDAYTFIVRERVYANAQTGNVVMMSTYFMRQEWAAGARYLFPLIAFALGVYTAELIHQIAERRRRKRHWRQYIVLIEALIMLAVGFLGQELNMLANSLVSFACAMQVQSFRTVHGYAYASTMCIGNLRACMDAMCDYNLNRNKKSLTKAKYYARVIFFFAVGAGIGGNISPLLRERTVWICFALLAFCYWLMGWKGRKKSHLKEIFEQYEW